MYKHILTSIMPIALSASTLAQDSNMESTVFHQDRSSNGHTQSSSLQFPHFYLGGRLGAGYFQDACDSNVSDCNDVTLAGGVYAGYHVNDWFALEGGVTNYGKPDARYTSGSTSIDAYGTELSAKFSYRLSSKWEVFSRIGTAYQNIEKQSDWEDKQTSQDWNTLLTTGINYQINQRWSLRGEHQFVDGIGDDEVLQSDLHFTSLGLTYHFGQEPPLPPKSETVMELEPEPITTEQEQVSLDANTLFGFDSVEPQSNTQLDELITKLKVYSVGKITIKGFTDNSGSDAYNRLLSERRAQAVANYLSKNGVSAERMNVMGMGEKEPIADNATAIGRAQNRRVEVHFETTIEKTEARTQEEAQ
ncbi:OmpA family protein [Vibrio jasicida]|uniref:OmpA family protein n=1 Tax=Vibrio jasicida TaxID=766224 RepID=A0ABW7JF46_9VIBR